MTADIRRRLDRLEAGRPQGAPTRVLSDHWMEPDEAGGLLSRWRELVLQRRATVEGAVLFVVSPEMTEAEWVARHVTAH